MTSVVVMESEEDITEQNLIQDIPMVTYGYEALRETAICKGITITIVSG